MRIANSWAVFAAVALSAGAPEIEAQIVRGFSPRFSSNANGDITTIGNTVMSCSGGGQCNNARNGTGGSINNNDFNMQYVDVDGDGSTFSSSTATLSTPAGTTVMWAGLYWGGNSSNAARNTVRFATPIAGYVNLTATQLDATGSIYQGFRDVTALVQAGGNGTYRVANVRSTTGSNMFGGWGLVVAYRDPALPARNLVVFDGFAHVAPGATVGIGVAGFVTPPAGAVNTRLGVLTYEGDRGFTGDGFRLNATVLSDAVNPGNNFFNSSISRFGVNVTTKNPNYVNQLGFDLDLVNANGILPNGATGATITLNSTADRYYPGAVTFATDLYAPVIEGTGFVKGVTDLDGPPARPGDLLEYLVTMSNTGQDAAAAVVMRDTLPANATYVPGSFEIVTGANAGAKTDVSGDDQMEYVAAARSVVARLGAGAGAVTGGQLPPGASTSLRFRVQIDSPLANGTLISNQAWLAFDAAQLGTSHLARSDGDPAAPGYQPTIVTVTAGVAISGWAYHDMNHNLQREVGEAGSGEAIVAKLVPDAAPLAAVQAVTVDPSTGAYLFTFVDAGSYTVRLDNNPVLSDVTPSYPSGWIGTQAPLAVRNVVVGGADATNQNFGLWQGSRVEGVVFQDDGAGSGVPNDGTPEAGEQGLDAVRVRLAAPGCPGGACDSATTDGAGRFTLWLRFMAAGTGAVVSEVDPTGFLSTGGSPGTTGGAYVRSTDVIGFATANGVVFSGLAFADVPPNSFVADGFRTVPPGGVAFYPHTFVARSAGALTFSAAQSPTPAIPGWSVELYRDLDCDGALDAGEPLVGGAIASTTGQTHCLLLKHFSPAGAPDGAIERVDLAAQYDYTGATPALSATALLADLTTVAVGTGNLEITKVVDQPIARAGDLLTYTITYRNLGPDPVTALALQDFTPSHTVFEGASCGALGVGLGSCLVSTQPAVGAIGTLTWTFTGALAPGGSGSVTFRVRVQ